MDTHYVFLGIKVEHRHEGLLEYWKRKRNESPGKIRKNKESIYSRKVGEANI